MIIYIKIIMILKDHKLILSYKYQQSTNDAFWKTI